MNYFNSTFRIKPGAKTLARSTKPMKRSGKLRPVRKKVCLWVGKKTLKWMRVRAKLKRKFDAAGITACELGYPGCWKDESLGFAHGKKRRKLIGDELETLVVLACNSCHDRIERLPAPAMMVIVESVIAERGWS